MSGDLSNAKYHLLSWLCSECNDPQCNNSNQQNKCSSISNTVQLEENVPGNITTNNITNSTHSESSNTSRDTNEHIACRNHDDGNITTVSQDFLNEFKFSRRGVHIANFNIRHVKPKLDQVKIMLQGSAVDIFGVCETFLNKAINDETLHVNGFTHERKDREDCSEISSNNGGGILIYLREGLDYVRRNDIETSDVESIWIEVKIRQSNSFLVCSAYRPPSSPTEWTDKFSRQIEKSLTFTDEIYLMGDFNIDIKDEQLCNTKWKHAM